VAGRLYHATCGRLFAAIYESMIQGSEEAGLADRRRELLTRASGATLEIGAGTGLNLAHYPPAVSELVVTEPSEHMARRLRDHLARASRPAEVVEAPAERLPFPDDRFDTVVCTLVLCTVPDPPAALAEVARVLRSEGRLLFLEHVRSDDPGIARWQDRLSRPWRFMGDGCTCNRDTVATLRASALTVDDVERGELEKAPPIVRPLVFGSATATGA
jgi:ubiquinone/menaquinone biosynthesis C-methylase UbiE